ncbi:MAG: biotin--[acetyl-CoA-carboxylase] ligase [Archaeoglobaceae archaeon]
MRLTERSVDYLIYLELLKGYASGEEIARRLGISRTAVWKQIDKMRRYLSISSKPGVGYCIISERDPNPYAIAKASFENLEVSEVFYYKSVDSTNERARIHGKSSALFFAEQQTAGRGRMGREWKSETGGLYFSITFPSSALKEVQRFTVISGVAVARAVDGKLKWPNDVLLEDKKVCGILCELSGSFEEPVVIVGIGVNVRNKYENAASLCDYGICSINEVFARIAREFKNLKLKSWGEILEEYRKLCTTLGRKVRIYTPSGILEGIAEDVDENGALLVSGKTVLVGDCIHLRS